MKVKIGWIVAGVLALAIGGTYLYDVAQAKAYEFELLSVISLVDGSSDIVVDGESRVEISVKLSKNDKPVEGHTVYIYASNGTLPTSRFITNVDGEITFEYDPYVYLNDELTPLKDVTFYLQDESNSTFFMINAEAEFSFPVIKPEVDGVQRDWQDVRLEVEDEN